MQKLNDHIHYHCCIIDALFFLDDGVLHICELPALSQADIAAIQTRVSQRVLRWVPPPRVHRHQYQGVLAPNSPLRTQVTALPQETTEETTRTTDADQTDGPDSLAHSHAYYVPSPSWPAG